MSEDEPTASTALDALRTPTQTPPSSGARSTFDGEESDDARFSTVSLTGSASAPITSASSLNEPGSSAVNGFKARRSTILLESSRPALGSGHTKGGSNATITAGSLGNLQMLLHRLEVTQSDPKMHRASIDGQQKIQEEFQRLHLDRRKGKESDQSNGGGTEVNGDEDHAEGEETKIDWDFWGEVMADYQQFAREKSEQLAGAIQRGIPGALRGMLWQLMSASKDQGLEQTYSNLIKESSPHEKAILRDLGRTFPHHEFFMDGQGVGQENLFNVLKAYSLYDVETGYCQGLPFVVAILLLNMPEEEAFCVLVRLMYSYDLRGHFLPEMPGLQLRLFQFDRLVEEFLPVLHVHFLRQGIKSSMFCSQWLLTMCSYHFPLDVVFRIYDNCLATGIEAIFGFSLVLLQKNEAELLNLKFDDIMVYLKKRLFVPYALNPEDENSKVRVDEFVHDSVTVKITPFMLDAFLHEYEDLVRARDAHAIEVDTLRNSNRQLSAHVKTLESNLASLNEEHCETLKELVLARIKHEDTENELVRYKLLYAEAVHETEDALARSSVRMSTSRRSSGSSRTGWLGLKSS